MKTCLFLCGILISITGYAQSGHKPVQFINPSTVSTPKGYSHAAVIDLGTCNMVILSGQVALDAEGNLVGKDDMAGQALQVFQNIKNIITAAGGTMNDVVKLNFYVKDVSAIQAIRDARDQYINLQSPPASTLVQVSRLFRPDILLEVEATAIVSKK